MEEELGEKIAIAWEIEEEELAIVRRIQEKFSIPLDSRINLWYNLLCRVGQLDRHKFPV